MKEYGVASNELTDNKLLVSWKNFLGNVFFNFKNEGFDFSHISQMNIILVCNKVNMMYDYYMKHNKHAVEWDLNQIINKDKNLINKLPATWVHPLNRKFERYRL